MIFVWAVDSQFLLYEANIWYREQLLCCFLEHPMAYDIFRIFVDEILHGSWRVTEPAVTNRGFVTQNGLRVEIGDQMKYMSYHFDIHGLQRDTLPNY